MDNLNNDLETGLTQTIEYENGTLPAKGSERSDNMLLLWTIQSEDVYEELMREGVYHTKPELAFCRDIPEIEFCYKWMAQKLSEKAGPPPKGVTYPVWAWHTWEGKRKRRDLRSRNYGFPGDKLVQMEIKISKDRILLSDFELWCAVLNGLNLGIKSEPEYDEFDERLNKAGFRLEQQLLAICDPIESSYDKAYPEEVWQLRDEIIKSWEICLGTDQEYNDWYMHYGRKCIQTVFWELRKEDVKKEWHFTCR